MSQVVRSARGRLVPTLRRWQARLDDPEVRGARRLVQRLAEGPLDVLCLGDSTTLFTAPDDTDQRPLDVMLRDELGAGTTVHTVAGGGYSPALLSGYVRLLELATPRPVVVLPITTRLAYPAWVEHPVYGYARATAAVQRIDLARSARRIRTTSPRHTEAALRAHDATPHATLAGRATVGEHRGPLRDPAGHGLSETDRLRLLYAYHYTARLEPGSPGLAAFTDLGARLRGLGCRIVAYENSVPVQRGVELLGPDFEDRVRESYALVDAAFAAGFGSDSVLRTGLTFGTGEFIDPDDGTEHLNQHGRLHLVREVAAALRAQLSER